MSKRPVPDSAVRLWAGIFLDSVGFTNQAYGLYQKANHLDPFNQNLVNYLARSLLIRGEPEKALSLWRGSVDQTGRGFNLGITWLAMGDFDEARRLLSNFQTPAGASPSRYVDLVIDAVADPQNGPAAENTIFEAERTGEIGPGEAFDLFWLMGSAALFDVQTDLAPGIQMLRVSAIAWSTQGAEFRGDGRFHTWAQDIGLVDFWNVHGWPDYCQPGLDGAFEC
jgi:tetratricopeptide (TPR) repeat protein